MRTELMPNETELSRINALTPVDLERDQVAVLPALAIDQQLTAYDTKIDESWMTKAAQDANGEEGVSFLKHHDKNSDPVGRVFFAEIDKSDSKNLRLLVKAFTANQDVAEDYATARFKAVSALVASSWLKCGACGNEWLSDECLQAAEDKKHEAPESSWYRWLFGKYVHVPGVEYDKEKCFLWHMADMDDQHSGMLELSMVYKGASAGNS